MRRFIVLIALLSTVVAARAQSVGTLLASAADNCGRPVAGARLTLRESGRSAVSTSGGHIALAGLSPGTYHAELLVPGYPAQSVSFEISSGRVTDIGTLSVGSEPSSCRTSGLYRDVNTVRVVSLEQPDESSSRSIVFEVVKDCAGACE
jgi:hypothetical protein